MGSISDHLEDELLDHVFNASYTPPSTVYLALSTADPGDDAAGISEPVGNNYSRKAITFDAAASRLINQTSTVTFDQATGSWGTISHWAIYDASSGGNMMAHGSLSASKAVVSGNTPSVAAGEVDISFKTLASKGDTTNNVSDYLADELLDFAFRNQAFSEPATYLALCTADLSDSSTGATMTECANANGYARKQVNVNGGSSPTWDLSSSGNVDNTHDITFASPTGSWGTVTALVILDGGTHGAGNVLFYDNGITEQTPDNGDTVKILAGNCDISLT
ncbi:MAG: hypothetical protein GWN00_21115 [Aliifodinibius sp.]|nr:hypothetical protein [Fodinibius sp.]NIY27215.1 hypothetical protein [Fodinibius sp.]